MYIFSDEHVNCGILKIIKVINISSKGVVQLREKSGVTSPLIVLLLIKKPMNIDYLIKITIIFLDSDY